MNCHIILAAKTEKGVYDLNFALSEANLTGYYYRPRVDMELLLDPRSERRVCHHRLHRRGVQVRPARS